MESTPDEAMSRSIARPRGRFDAVDVARGVALAAMAAYHFTWDVGFLQLTPTNVAQSPMGHAAARIIAGSFLFLVGASLVLAHGGGVRWASFWRRLAVVAGAALVITLATVFAIPEEYIFFGILHAIALSSLLGLPLLKAPVPVVIATGALVLATPLVLTQPAFDAPALAFLGLGTRLPITNDYVPVFPWFGVVLIGIAAARLTLPRWSGVWARWRAENPLTRALAWAGRRSLPIYLVHQPLLLAALYPIALALGPNPVAEAAPFLNFHEENCRRTGQPAELCRSAGSCLVARLRAEGLWTDVLRNQLDQAKRERVIEWSQQCFAAEPGG